MEEIASYYVTLKPISKDGKKASGAHNIAYVDDPAIEEIGVYLARQDERLVADDKTQHLILEYLKGCGQELPSHWREVSEEEYLADKKAHLTNDPTERESFNDRTKGDGQGQWLVRYKYTGPQDARNRSFCSEVLSLNRIYTEEEIKNGLSNPEFGNYSIWDYKGSYGCRHRWKRQIYFEDYEDDEVRRVGAVPQVTAFIDDGDATTLNAFLSSNEKMQVCAPLLIPNKPVYRNDELGRYNMLFTKDTIVDLREIAMSENLFKKKDLFKDTHEGGPAPAHTVDQWIIEDENDKAYTDYGFTAERCPIGTWMVLSQVTDKQYWNREIKQNKKHAYSIEALINMTIVEMSKLNNKNEVNMEKEQVVLPDGEHLIDGKIYIVEAGQVIATKEVTPEQEEIVKEVAEEKSEGAEVLAETPKVDPEKEKMSEEKKPKEEMSYSDKPKEEMSEDPKVEEDDRISKLEKKIDEIITLIAEDKTKSEESLEEEKKIEMSDNRSTVKKMSDSLNYLITSKNRK